MKNTPTDFSLFDNMIEGVHVMNYEWTYVYTNDVFVQQSTYTREELLGANVLDLFPALDQTEMYQCLEKTLVERVPTNRINYYEFPNDYKGWFDVRVHPIEEGILVMSIDITKQKQLQDQIKQANKLLELKVEERTKELSASLFREKELNKMKTSFVSMASHEFKTPLSAILSSTSLIEHFIKNNMLSKTDKHINRVKSSVNNMVNLLNDFLSFDKLQKGVIDTKLSTFCIETLLLDIDNEIVMERGDKQELLFTIEGSNEVGLHKPVVRNILSNLISNAFKYSEDNVFAKVIVSDDVTITIEDKGLGIPESQRDCIFTEFFRANNTDGINGTGLGLNIVKHYVDLLGGEISFSSEENKGTIFKVVLKNIA